MTDHADLPAELAPVTLVLGGARSGKSAFAEALAEQTPNPIYIATARAGDAEMAARIRRHRARRDRRWTTVEEPVELAAALRDAARPGRAVLVDCLTLWLSNLMGASHDVDERTAGLVQSLGALAGPVILVSNEVGFGIVPENRLAREFRDHAGRLHQAVAARAQRVHLVVAGIPMTVKGPTRG